MTFSSARSPLSLSLTPKPAIKGFCLKADIRHYFETIDNNVLINILRKKIADDNILFLVKKILKNYNGKVPNKGMPLGNLTSQFFANVYLNELDQFVKHQLKVKYYIRYVDDFVILHKNKEMLEFYKQEIKAFLTSRLGIELHKNKSGIISLSRGVDFLGFRIFYHHKLLRKSNRKRLTHKPTILKEQFEKNLITYDQIYDSMLGSFASAKQANTYKLRKNLERQFERLFQN